MVTDIDENLSIARKHLKEAQIRLSKVSNPENLAYDEYSPEFMEKIMQINSDLFKLRNKLGI